MATVKLFASATFFFTNSDFVVRGSDKHNLILIPFSSGQTRRALKTLKCHVRPSGFRLRGVHGKSVRSVLVQKKLKNEGDVVKLSNDVAVIRVPDLKRLIR